MLGRLNEEIRRRSRIVRLVPNEASCLRHLADGGTVSGHGSISERLLRVSRARSERPQPGQCGGENYCGIYSGRASDERQVASPHQRRRNGHHDRDQPARELIAELPPELELLAELDHADVGEA